MEQVQFKLLKRLTHPLKLVAPIDAQCSEIIKHPITEYFIFAPQTIGVGYTHTY